MPRGLRAVRVAVTVLAPVFALALLAAALDVVPRRIGYSVGGRAVSRGEWLRVAAPLFALSALWFGAAAVGMWRGRRWARGCIVGAFATVLVYALGGLLAGTMPPALAWRAVAEAGVIGAAAWWYLYRKANVAAYFDGLRGGD